jgi:hypothetical protein
MQPWRSRHSFRNYVASISGLSFRCVAGDNWFFRRPADPIVAGHGALSTSRLDVGLFRLLILGDVAGSLHMARRAGWVSSGAKGQVISREDREAEAKLVRLGMIAPWVTIAGSAVRKGKRSGST